MSILCAELDGWSGWMDGTYWCPGSLRTGRCNDELGSGGRVEGSPMNGYDVIQNTNSTRRKMGLERDIVTSAPSNLKGDLTG